MALAVATGGRTRAAVVCAVGAVLVCGHWAHAVATGVGLLAEHTGPPVVAGTCIVFTSAVARAIVTARTVTAVVSPVGAVEVVEGPTAPVITHLVADHRHTQHRLGVEDSAHTAIVAVALIGEVQVAGLVEIDVQICGRTQGRFAVVKAILETVEIRSAVLTVVTCAVVSIGLRVAIAAAVRGLSCDDAIIGVARWAGVHGAQPIGSCVRAAHVFGGKLQVRSAVAQGLVEGLNRTVALRHRLAERVELHDVGDDVEAEREGHAQIQDQRLLGLPIEGGTQLAVKNQGLQSVVGVECALGESTISIHIERMADGFVENDVGRDVPNSCVADAGAGFAGIGAGGSVSQRDLVVRQFVFVGGARKERCREGALLDGQHTLVPMAAYLAVLLVVFGRRPTVELDGLGGVVHVAIEHMLCGRIVPTVAHQWRDDRQGAVVVARHQCAGGRHDAFGIHGRVGIVVGRTAREIGTAPGELRRVARTVHGVVATACQIRRGVASDHIVDRRVQTVCFTRIGVFSLDRVAGAVVAQIALRFASCSGDFGEERRVGLIGRLIVVAF